MTDLYSIQDVAQILGLQVPRLRYWAQTGFVGPSVRKGGRVYYTFQDLIGVRAAKELLDAGLSMQAVRKNLASLRTLLPDVAHPASKMRICSDGERVVAVDKGVAFEPATGQVVMSFEVDVLSSEVAEILALPTVAAGVDAPTPPPEDRIAIADLGEDEPMLVLADPPQSAYQCFMHACDAEDRNDLDTAEQLYRLAIERQPSLAAAHTNLGSLLYRRGDAVGARAAYERALEYEPAQAEARYNLGNLLEDMGETEQAIAELRRVCWANPDFADAHYNLGLVLARVGGIMQACKHLRQYLELDGSSEWSDRARSFLETLEPAAAAR